MGERDSLIGRRVWVGLMCGDGHRLQDDWQAVNVRMFTSGWGQMVLRFFSSNEPSLVMLWKGDRMDRWNPSRQETPHTHLCSLGQIRDTFQVLKEDTDLMSIMLKDAHVNVYLVAFRGP